ncbi:MAG: sigma-70 family RNA polymerase sigma factor [Saprospiraceae bacterium]|nr:sigma-70 family RNA polymerase sigma factor [Saprospiraceae bacterium]
MSFNQDEGDIKNFLLNRDRQSCQNLVRRYQNAVFRICYNVLKDHQKAEEVAQDVFMKAFDQLKQLKDPLKFRSWIGRMAYHRAIDVWRRQKHNTADLPLPFLLRMGIRDRLQRWNLWRDRNRSQKRFKAWENLTLLFLRYFI